MKVALLIELLIHYIPALPVDREHVPSDEPVLILMLEAADTMHVIENRVGQILS
ncbi:MAG: hypothetical protein ACI8P0_006660 [Planctomycetaceae bacterium]|jgi:hypothetical protein